MISLGREIKKARIDKKWNQKALQDATGISQKHISAIELDKVDPRWSLLQRIALALDLPMDRITRETAAHVGV